MKKFLRLTEGKWGWFWAGSKRSEHRLCGRVWTEQCYQICGPLTFSVSDWHKSPADITTIRRLSPCLGVLNWMSVYPQIHTLDPNLRSDGVRKWGFWEVVTSWAQGIHRWDQCPHQRGPQEHSRHPSCEELVKRQPSMNQEAGSSPDTICQHLDLEFPSLKHCEKYISVYKLPSLWHLAVAAWMHWAIGNEKWGAAVTNTWNVQVGHRWRLREFGGDC